MTEPAGSTWTKASPDAPTGPVGPARHGRNTSSSVSSAMQIAVGDRSNRTFPLSAPAVITQTRATLEYAA
jgi:hypothetical protein